MARDIQVVYEDRGVLVADKPAGLLTVAGEGPSLEARLSEGGGPVRAAHRLDRDVSGCVLCARDPALLAALQDLFRERALEKVYWALAQGRVQPERGAWKYPLLEERGQGRVSARGRPAETRFRVLAQHPLAAELELELVTGRYNQIRVHAAHAGFPLAGERKYARGKDDPLRAPRLALHAWRLAFRHPATGEEVRARAELPPELEALRAAAAAQRARKPPFASPGS